MFEPWSLEPVTITIHSNRDFADVIKGRDLRTTVLIMGGRANLITQVLKSGR